MFYTAFSGGGGVYSPCPPHPRNCAPISNIIYMTLSYRFAGCRLKLFFPDVTAMGGFSSESSNAGRWTRAPVTACPAAAVYDRLKFIGMRAHA